MGWCSVEDDYFPEGEFHEQNGVRMHKPPDGPPHPAGREPTRQPRRSARRKSLSRKRDRKTR